MVRAAFSHSVSGRMFPGCTVSFWRKSTQIGKLLRSYSSKNESLEGEFLGIFYLKICFKYWRSSEAVCHHRKFGDKLLMGLIWISWESCLLIYHLLQFQKIFTLRLPNDPAQVPQPADPGGVQLFLQIYHLDKSKGLILGVWWHNGLLTVSIMDLSVRLK